MRQSAPTGCTTPGDVIGSGVLARAIVKARQAAGLTVTQFATLLDLDASTIQAWESGARAVEPGQFDGVARLFGMEMTQFLGADLSNSPSSLLYRSMAGGSALDLFAGSRLPLQLGEFMRCARITAECDQLSGEAPPSLAWLDDLGPAPLAAESRVPHNAEALARRVRDRLGLGDRPIASMRTLLRDLGVALFFADPDSLDASVDAACMVNPRPAILVNVLAGGEKWWRTRMSLAHELAHLCFDNDVLGARRHLFLFSPAEKAARSWHLFDRFEALEQRANAFAAYFLAPPAGVRALISPSEATSPVALQRLASHFGVGQETAANVLKNVFDLSDVQRYALLSAPLVELPSNHPDRVTRPRLRDEVFTRRVLSLLRDDKIDGVRARRWLRLGAHESLPKGYGLSREQRAPIVTPLDRARQRLEFLIHTVLKDHTLHVGHVEMLPAARLRAQVVRPRSRDDEELVGHVVLESEDLRIVQATGPGLAALTSA